ncbi:MULTISPECIES: ribonuclease Z [Bacillaceae]|uniref:Ribonuclease Z n=1 Tax=Evansella alkalicola TaxID=745819 RepID=A0ABS6JUX6_9BACI|nr:MULTISPECIES: ribonuclease Z [Bacillaceae]MBU9722375.1 ribonuclease Z [Bacillus alkalicola]
MKITFLGTGSGVPAKHRNVSSFALQLMNKTGSIWLFDCGEATQHQILHTPIKTRRIEKIFITHLHGDHIYGLPGLLGSRSFQGAEEPLTVYGPRGIEEFIQTSLNVSQTCLKYPLEIKELRAGDILMNDEEWCVRCEQLEHGIPSFGFRLEQKDTPGPLLIEKVKEAAIPTGPHLKLLKEGKDITLEDGRVIRGKDFVGPPKPGMIIAVLGDTRFSEKSIQFCIGADLIIHEATFRKMDEQLANDYFHSTTVQAAEVALKADAKMLILNHISSRYQSPDIEELLHEAREIFPNTFIAEDFSTFNIG